MCLGETDVELWNNLLGTTTTSTRYFKNEISIAEGGVIITIGLHQIKLIDG